jgi:hypothetical protein
MRMETIYSFDAMDGRPLSAEQALEALQYVNSSLTKAEKAFFVDGQADGDVGSDPVLNGVTSSPP